MGKRRNPIPFIPWLLGGLLLLGAILAQVGNSAQAGQAAIKQTKVPYPLATSTPTDTATATIFVSMTPTNTPRPTRTPIPTSTPCPIQFSDVPPGSTYYDYVRCLACRGFVSGYPDGTFRPNNLVTRGQLSKIVSNAAGFSEPAGAQQFEDVAPGSTFYDYIWRLADRGYIGGYACGSVPSEPCVPPENRPYFRPNVPVTRGQAIKIEDNAAGFLEPCSGQTFEDLPPGHPAYCHAEHLASRGIIFGYPCGGPGEPCVPPENRPYFQPGRNATRGQVARMTARLFYPSCSTPSVNP